MPNRFDGLFQGQIDGQRKVAQEMPGANHTLKLEGSSWQQDADLLQRLSAILVEWSTQLNQIPNPHHNQADGIRQGMRLLKSEMKVWRWYGMWVPYHPKLLFFRLVNIWLRLLVAFKYALPRALALSALLLVIILSLQNLTALKVIFGVVAGWFLDEISTLFPGS